MPLWERQTLVGAAPPPRKAGTACPKSSKPRPEGGPPTKAKQKPKPAPAPVVQPKPCNSNPNPVAAAQPMWKQQAHVEAADPCGSSRPLWERRPRRERQAQPAQKAQSIAPGAGLPQKQSKSQSLPRPRWYSPNPVIATQTLWKQQTLVGVADPCGSGALAAMAGTACPKSPKHRPEARPPTKNKQSSRPTHCLGDG